jgi:transcription elongation factor SPT6
MSMQDLIQGEAELDDEENDESFDEETGETTRRDTGNGHIDDSSEEEEDDDDEEEARKVCSRATMDICATPLTAVRFVKVSS